MTNFIGIDGSKNGWVAVQQNSENLKQQELKFLNKYSKKNKNFQLDDFLDACALSWTAKRVVNKKNINIPEEEIKDNYGIIMQMKI